MLSATLFYQPIRQAQEMVTQLIAIDTQMTTLARVTDGDLNITKVLGDSIELADTLGNKISEINDL